MGDYEGGCVILVEMRTVSSMLILMREDIELVTTIRAEVAGVDGLP